MEESHLSKSRCTRVNAYLPEPWGDVIAAHAHSWSGNRGLYALSFSVLHLFTHQTECLCCTEHTVGA